MIEGNMIMEEKEDQGAEPTTESQPQQQPTNINEPNYNEEMTEQEEEHLLRGDEYESDTGLQGLTQLTPDLRPPYDNNDIELQINETNLTNNDKNEQTNETQTETTTLDNKAFDQTKISRTFSNIPQDLHASFKTLNSLKHTRNKTKTTIQKLTNHQQEGTLPQGLSKIRDCNILLNDDHRRRWIQASIDAGKAQLNILIEHHKQKLKTTEEKIEQATHTIQDNSTTKEIAEQILETTDHISNKYTTRELLKTTTRSKQKQVKRLNTKRKNANNRNETANKQHTPTTQSTKTLPTNTSTGNRRSTSTITTPTSNFMRTVNPRLRTPTRTLDNSIVMDIQRQISDFLTPTHIRTFIQQTTTRNRPK